MRIRAALLLLLLTSTADAERLKPGAWIGTAGLGFMASPTLFLVTPQLERVFRHNVFFGSLLQAGIGGTGALFTIEATARMQLGPHPRLRPTIEAGLGVTAATPAFNSVFGIAMHLGMGADYLIDADLAISMVLRACFSPPVQTFFLSWPVAQVRYLF